MDPPPRPGHHASHREHGQEEREAAQVQDGGGPDEEPVVDAHHREQGEEPYPDPGELAPGHAVAAARGQRPQGREAQRDDHQRGHEEQPVHVMEQAPVDADHESLTAAMATLSRKIAS